MTPEQREAIKRILSTGAPIVPHYANTLLADLEAVEARVKELGEQLEFDRSAVAGCLTAANNAIDGRYWLTEGRGPYEWDDDNWHKEFYAAATEIKDAIAPLTSIAANWRDCPVKAGAIAEARIDLKSKTVTFERERDEAREKLAAAAVHQQETDARIVNQRVEINRQADEIKAQNKRLGDFDKWKRECDQWQAYPTSAFWRISELEKKLAAAELAMAQIRASVEKEEHTESCATRPLFHNRPRIELPCDCIKSRIPTGPDSPLVEAVKEVVNEYLHYGRNGGPTVDMMMRLVALAPDSWKQPRASGRESQ